MSSVFSIVLNTVQKKDDLSAYGSKYSTECDVKTAQKPPKKCIPYSVNPYLQRNTERDGSLTNRKTENTFLVNVNKLIRKPGEIGI